MKSEKLNLFKFIVYITFNRNYNDRLTYVILKGFNILKTKIQSDQNLDKIYLMAKMKRCGSLFTLLIIKQKFHN